MVVEGLDLDLVGDERWGVSHHKWVSLHHLFFPTVLDTQEPVAQFIFQTGTVVLHRQERLVIKGKSGSVHCKHYWAFGTFEKSVRDICWWVCKIWRGNLVSGVPRLAFLQNCNPKEFWLINRASIGSWMEICSYTWLPVQMKLLWL